MSTTTDFDRLARAWLDDGPTQLSDRALDAALTDVHLTRQRRALRVPWRFPQMPAPSRAAGVAVLVLVALVAGGAIWYVGQSPDPSPPLTSDSPVPSLGPSPTPAPSVAARVLSWPGNAGSNEPGLYSWDGVNCVTGRNCLVGVLHNHLVTGVRIEIARILEWSISDASATPVTVAGHQGLYLRVSQQLEKWNVDFDGTLVSISLLVETGASGAVAEAQSIIESLAYEEQDTPIGFRLVFTLPSRNWDSPF